MGLRSALCGSQLRARGWRGWRDGCCRLSPAMRRKMAAIAVLQPWQMAAMAVPQPSYPKWLRQTINTRLLAGAEQESLANYTSSLSGPAAVHVSPPRPSRAPASQSAPTASGGSPSSLPPTIRWKRLGRSRRSRRRSHGPVRPFGGDMSSPARMSPMARRASSRQCGTAYLQERGGGRRN